MRLHAQRGQALTETAVFLPLFMLALFGLIWLVQVSVIRERAQIAVRYSGLISNEASPYDGFSLYSIYNNVGAFTQAATTVCATPPPDAFTNSSQNLAFPGPNSPEFFSPDQGSTTGSCNSGRVQLSGGALSAPMLLLSTNSSVSTNKTSANPVTPNAAPQINTLTAQSNFLNAPDLASLLHCYPDLHTAVSNSLVGEQQAGANPGISMPLPDINPTNPLTLNSPC